MRQPQAKGRQVRPGAPRAGRGWKGPLLRPSEGALRCPHLDSGPQNCEGMHFCCFQSPSLWQFIRQPWDTHPGAPVTSGHVSRAPVGWPWALSEDSPSCSGPSTLLRRHPQQRHPSLIHEQHMVPERARLWSLDHVWNPSRPLPAV